MDTISREDVEEVLEALRPRLEMDGGGVELKEITPEGVVRLRLTGACQGCPMSSMTLQWAIEEELKRRLPRVKGVEAS